MMLKRLFLAAALMSGACPAWAATNFLEAPGTNGAIATPFVLDTTELNALGSGLCVTSSVNGTSGVFSQSNAGSAPWSSIFFSSGGAFTPVAGQVLMGWFLHSSDGGTTFETQTATCSTTVAPLPRPADFTIPLSVAAYASGNRAYASGPVLNSWDSYKVIIWNANQIGAVTALPATGNTITLFPKAIQY
jgi:hypothetical protein